MHYEQRAKDRMVTDEHLGYDARAHWCGEDRYAGEGLSWGQEYNLYDRPAPRPNLRRVRAWAAWAKVAALVLGTITACLAVIGVACLTLGESHVWP